MKVNITVRMPTMVPTAITFVSPLSPSALNALANPHAEPGFGTGPTELAGRAAPCTRLTTRDEERTRSAVRRCAGAGGAPTERP